MIKFGKITEVDYTKGLARVTFEEDDNLTTAFIPMAVPKSKIDKFSIPFDVNEHVCCMMDENCEDGVILCAIYDAANAPAITGKGKAGVQFDTSLSVIYNRNDQTLSVTGSGNVVLDITGNASIKANKVTIESLTELDLKAATKVNVQGTEINLTAPQVNASALMQVAGVVTAGGIAAAVIPGGSGGGNVTIAGDIAVTGKVEAAEVKEGSIRLGTHKHGGVSSGGAQTTTPI